MQITRVRLLTKSSLFAVSHSIYAVWLRAVGQQFFVNLSPVADRKDPNEPGFAIDSWMRRNRLTCISISRLIRGEVARLKVGLNLKNVRPA
jgi:hypothetical protein